MPPRRMAQNSSLRLPASLSLMPLQTGAEPPQRLVKRSFLWLLSVPLWAGPEPPRRLTECSSLRLPASLPLVPLQTGLEPLR
jgi:hypothetical protein